MSSPYPHPHPLPPPAGEGKRGDAIETGMRRDFAGGSRREALFIPVSSSTTYLPRPLEAGEGGGKGSTHPSSSKPNELK